MNINSTLLTAACAALTLAYTQAALTITITEVGSDVVMSGFGDVNTTDLTFASDGSATSGIEPFTAFFIIGASNVDYFTGFTSTSTFGSGGFTTADSSSGQAFGYTVFHSGSLALPSGYINQQPLNSSATYPGETLSSLGVTPGTYTFTWGSGANADSLTITAVPESASYATLAGLLCIGLVLWRRRASSLKV